MIEKTKPTAPQFTAIIFQPAKTAMQSGQGPSRNAPMRRKNNACWQMEFLDQGERWVEPLMGWTASKNMLHSEFKLKFETQEAAERYAVAHGIVYEVIQPTKRKMVPKSYASNFV